MIRLCSKTQNLIVQLNRILVSSIRQMTLVTHRWKALIKRYQLIRLWCRRRDKYLKRESYLTFLLMSHLGLLYMISFKLKALMRSLNSARFTHLRSFCNSWRASKPSTKSDLHIGISMLQTYSLKSQT